MSYIIYSHPSTGVLDFLTERLKEYEAFSGEIPTKGKFGSRKKSYQLWGLKAQRHRTLRER